MPKTGERNAGTPGERYNVELHAPWKHQLKPRNANDAYP